MKKVHRNYAELIGFGIITTIEASELIGYARPNRIFQILQNKEGSSKSKDMKMWDVWKEKREALETAKRNSLEKFSETLPILSSVLGMKKPPQPQDAVKETKIVPINRPAIVNIMEGLLGLMSDKFVESLSEQDLALLQPSATIMLQLSARLSALGSRLLAVRVEKEVSDGEQR